MRRPLLVSLIVVGTIVTAVGGIGVFAPFSDRATTGTNTVSSGERPKAADLRLAYPVASTLNGGCDAATYSDNTTTTGHTITNAQPGSKDVRRFCLRNVGSSSLAVSVTPIDVVDVDSACTGDEEAAGDTTCGGDQGGELAKLLHVFPGVHSCETGSGPLPDFTLLSPAQSVSIGNLAAGGTMCGSIEVFYPLNRTDTEVLQAQSDTVTWRYAFDGTTN